jgi:uroporphyrinogen III methyltransferase/synthase
MITRQLIARGKSPETPAAAVRCGTTGEQRTVEAPLGDLADEVRRANLEPPALVVIGSVVALRSQLAWWEKRPLFGKRILVTRPRQQADDMLRRLEQLGAVAFALPAVAIGEPADWSPVDRALADLRRYHWLVFTSANGVHALIRRLRHLGRDIRTFGSLHLAAIGPATAEALRGYHLEPDVVPPRFDSETLAAVLCQCAAGKRVLLARADRGRDVLREELARVAEVEPVAVYSQTDAMTAGSAALERLKRGDIEYITITSSNIARALYKAVDSATRERILRGEIELVSISPLTSSTIRELGWPVAAEATCATVAGVIDALVLAVRDERQHGS